MAQKREARPRPGAVTIDLGIAGRRVPVHSHIACLWETEPQLAEALGFIEAGLRGADHCVVIGDKRDIERILPILRTRGLDVEDLRARKRLTVVERASTAQGMYDEVCAVLERLLAAGALLIRVSGIVGWDRRTGPPDAELFSYEARLTKMAQELPCVILCLHPVNALTGLIARHGVFATHPRMLEETGVLGNPFFDPFDRPERLNAVAARLSEDQDLRSELLRRTEILQAIFDNIPVMISLFDASGRPVIVNREWERVLGWSLEEARRTDILSETYPDPERRRDVLEFIQKAEGRWKNFKTRTRDGRLVDTSWVRVRLSDGTRIGFGLDITERKEAEEAARQIARKVQALSAQKEDHLRLVINTIPTMAWSLLPDGALDFVNQRWLDYTGLSLEEALRESTRTMHPDDLPRAMEKWLVDLAAGSPSVDEMRLRRGDGEYRWFLVRTVPLRDERGNIVKWYGSSTDIEDRKRTEEKLKATTRQLRALSARLQSAREEESTRIAREVHDEIGQALTALQMDVDWLGKKLGPSGAPESEKFAAKLRSMTKLIDQTIAAVQRIATDLRPGVLDGLGLEAAIEWYVREFEKRTGIACRIRSSINDVPIDPERATAVFRILQEALTNVARHAGATEVEVCLSADEKRLVLEIRDNGRGVSEDRIAEGRSLGLLGMRERALSLGGDVSIRGDPGHGTRVTLTVPR